MKSNFEMLYSKKCHKDMKILRKTRCLINISRLWIYNFHYYMKSNFEILYYISAKNVI